MQYMTRQAITDWPNRQLGTSSKRIHIFHHRTKVPEWEGHVDIFEQRVADEQKRGRADELISRSILFDHATYPLPLPPN